MVHKIVVDLREPDRMVSLLKAAGFEVAGSGVGEVREGADAAPRPEANRGKEHHPCAVKVKLAVGDYIIDDKLYFSWKSFEDFVASNHNDHLHNEIYDMLALPGDVFVALLVWGRDDADEETIALAESVIPTINAFYLPVFTTDTREDAVDLMWRWAEKCDEKARKYAKFPLQYRRRVEVAGALDSAITDTVRLYMNLPGIDKVLAVELEKAYPTMDLLVDEIKRTKDFSMARHKTKKVWAKQVWYARVPKVGPGKAKKIETVLLCAFDPQTRLI